MKNPELSIVFDSGIQFLDDETFNEVVMAEVELFREDEFTSLCDELQSWDVKSLNEMLGSLNTFLMTRDGRHLKLATNLVLDHCIGPEGKTDDFKIYIMANALEWAISVKEFEAMKASAQFSREEGQE